MKKKVKHTAVQRLYWKNAQRRWRAAHLVRARETRKRYWRKKAASVKLQKKKAKEVDNNGAC